MALMPLQAGPSAAQCHLSHTYRQAWQSQRGLTAISPLRPLSRTLRFSSDRSLPTHLPSSRQQAQRDFEHMDSWGYFTDYTNIWSIPLTPWLDANSNDHGIANAAD